MAESSGHWTTGAASGDSIASYTQAINSTIQKVIAACNGFEGVAPGYLNSLAGTVTGANTVSINTGAALVDGKYYDNTAAVSVNIPSAVGGGNTRIDRIVLRASWASYTVRITRIAGTDAAAPVVPAITQTSGTTYDILLYHALVTTAGAVTLTDERVYARQVLTGDVTVTAGNVTAIGASKVLATMLGGVTANRQGGSATDWAIAGSTNYAPTSSNIQVGVLAFSFAGSQVTDTEALTFPVAFSAKPIVLVSASSSTADIRITASAITSSGCTFSFFADVAVVAVSAYWIAIGPT
jgi:hypothetical protein